MALMDCEAPMTVSYIQYHSNEAAGSPPSSHLHSQL